MQYYQELVDQIISKIKFDGIPDELQKYIILEFCRLAVINKLDDEGIITLIDKIIKYKIHPFTEKDEQEQKIDEQRRDEIIFYLTLQNELSDKFNPLKKLVKYVKIPPNKTKINQTLFTGFENIETISLHENVTDLLEIKKWIPHLKEIIIFPSQNCDTSQILRSISQMNNVKATIKFPGENFAFVEFKILPNKNYKAQIFHLPPKISEIPDFFFRNCTELNEINFPHNLVEIGNFSFNGCTTLNEIFLNDNLIKIGESAFAGCKSLKKVHFNKKLMYIGSNAFDGCNQLVEADLSMCEGGKFNVKDFPRNCNVILPK